MIFGFFNRTLKKLQIKFETFRAQKLRVFYRGLIGSGGKVLDLGSGSGHVAQRIVKDCDVTVTCIDVVNNNLTTLPLIIYDGI